jgi:hypothetical protein
MFVVEDRHYELKNQICSNKSVNATHLPAFGFENHNIVTN